jgi:hypothetical protein
MSVTEDQPAPVIAQTPACIEGQRMPTKTEVRLTAGEALDLLRELRSEMLEDGMLDPDLREAIDRLASLKSRYRSGVSFDEHT